MMIHPEHLAIYFLSTGHEAEPMSMMDWLVSTNVFNVFLMAVALGYLIKKFNLFGIFETNRSKIEREIGQLESRKQEALAELESIRKRTANLSVEVEQILNQAKVSADALSKQILADAATQSEKLVEAAQRRIEVEQRAAAKDLEQRLLRDAIEDARQNLAGMAPADQRRSVESFLDELPKLTVK